MELKYRHDLYKLLPEEAVCAEIGVAEGYFSADILLWPNCKKLFMVDAWATLYDQTGDGTNPPQWHEANLKKAWDRIIFAEGRFEILRGISWEMASKVADGSLDLLYIDCCHSYECVMKDLNAWMPKLKDGGICAGHDYLNRSYGVFEAVKSYTDGKFRVYTIPENKDEDAGFYFVKTK